MSLTIKGRPIHFSLKWLKPPPVPPDGTMTLFEHLRELRYRLIVSALAIIVGMVVAWFFRYDLMDILQRPYFQAIAALKAQHPGTETLLVNINLTSPLTLALKVSALAGVIVTAPFWLYQLWAFVVPGLLAKEKKWALIFVAAATPMFVGGVIVGYIVLPKGITVLLSFTQSGVSNLQDLNAYLSFLLRMMVVFGIAFLLPLVVLMLNIVGVIKAKQIAKYRRLVIFGTFVFGAVATPSTDPFSMLALALPMTCYSSEQRSSRTSWTVARSGAPHWPATIYSSVAASPMTRHCGNSPRAATTASSPKGEPPDQAAGQTDKHVDAVPDLVERVRNEIAKSLSRFSERVSRVEVHLSDQNADRGGNEFGTSRATGRVVSAFRRRGSFEVTVLDGRPLSCRGWRG